MRNFLSASSIDAKMTVAEAQFLPAALEIIESPASPTSRLFGGMLISLFVIVVGWSCVGRIDIIATASGKVVPEGKTKLVQPLEPGIVKDILVHDGDLVQAGQALVRLTSAGAETDFKKISADLLQSKIELARLEALRAGLDDQDPLSLFHPPEEADQSEIERVKAQIRAENEEQEAKSAGIAQQIRQKKSQLQESRIAIEKYQKTIPLIEQEEAMRKTLYEEQWGSKLLYLDSIQRLTEAQQGLLAERQHEIQEIAAVRALEEENTRSDSEYSRQILANLSEAANKVDVMEQERAKAAERWQQQTLSSPIEGTVQQLSIHTIGGVVTAAQTLMVIVPRDVPMVVEAEIENRDIGFVAEGQKAAIKVDAFPFSRYGLLEGTVTSISRDSITASASPAPQSLLSADSDAATPSRIQAYVAQIALTRQSFSIDREQRRISAGMTVTAEIKTGKRRLISFLLAPLGEYAHDGLRER